MDEGSLEIVNAGEMYPKQPFVSDDGNTGAPFSLLSGENPLFRGRSSEGVLVITNYRLYHTENTFINVPLGLIEYVECREIFFLYICCKDGRTFRCVFESGEENQKWAKRIQACVKLSEKIEDCFAFRFLSWSREEDADNALSNGNCTLGTLLHRKNGSAGDDILSEAQRMGFDLQSVWKISRVNENFGLCPSYPRHLIVPALILDEELEDLAGYRYSSRVPAVVWRHQGNGCVIARSSQPRMGILSWRNLRDEKLIEAISSACSMDPGYIQQEEGFLRDIDGCGDDQMRAPIQKKLLIIDARSYAAAMTNRAKGGGYECNGYYPNCEVQYMGLANIHTIRGSFACLRALCAQPDDLNWLTSLENSKWLFHISGLLRSALVVVDAVDVEERPVLVHCSDGWDRTPQIVALAEIMLDPYYRTKKGFQVLVEREWLKFGHKFADRCGHPDGTDDRNERSPVFLQWLDCVYQLLRQFKCHFEFNEQYLARLAVHAYSCLFGTFLCNSEERRRTHSVPLRTFSVWPVLNERNHFHNYLYNGSTEILRPSFQIRSMEFWSELYLPGNCSSKSALSPPPIQETLPEDGNGIKPETSTPLVKTKSCEDIHGDSHPNPTPAHRRKSDPSLVENTTPQLYPSIPSAEVTNITVPTNERTDEKEIASEGESLVPKEPAMLGSTDTLVSECGALCPDAAKDDNQKKCCVPAATTLCSVGTDTSDLPITLEHVLQSVSLNANCLDAPGLPVWCHGMMGGGSHSRNCSKSCSSCGCATPRHSRSPSSGFPATPCDDTPTPARPDHPPLMDFDGLPITVDALQDRIKGIFLHYKRRVSNLHMELSAMRCEFLQQITRQYQGKELEDALIDPTADVPRESPGGSEHSWDMLWTSNDPVASSGV